MAVFSPCAAVIKIENREVPVQILNYMLETFCRQYDQNASRNFILKPTSVDIAQLEKLFEQIIIET